MFSESYKNYIGVHNKNNQIVDSIFYLSNFVRMEWVAVVI